MKSDTEIDITELHVEGVQRQVDHQQQLIADLKSKGQSSSFAEALLESFVLPLAAHQANLDRLKRKRDRVCY